VGRFRNLLANLSRLTEAPAPRPGGGVTATPSRKALQGYPYDAGSTGRRATAWQATRLGQNTLLWSNLDNIRARSRDAVRNNPWAASALDHFESNVIGTGIQPHWRHPDPKIIEQIQAAWTRWQENADFSGQLDFYGLQGVMAREIFEAGEVFVRYRLRPPSDRLYIPLQLQLLEGEQLPIWRNVMRLPNGGAVRSGIEFDAQQRRVAYHFYREHPGESMYYPEAYVFVRIPADEIRHVYKFIRAGQLRGEPRMTSVLALLYELEQYTDAALVKKKIAAMFAAFVKTPAPEDDPLPSDPAASNPQGAEPVGSPDIAFPDPGTSTGKLESGTMQYLLPGEDITFTNVPQEADFEAFMRTELHKFATGVGMTYEQITGDLKGVNYSSIRAGMLEFRRACEQFQYMVLVQQGCQPIMKRWLDEAVLAGKLDLPGYFEDPYPYQQVDWVTPGWEWVDPLKEAQAAQMDVRNGFISRSMVIRSRGLDPSVVDEQQVQERARADQKGLVYDSDPNKTFLHSESAPDVATTPQPDEPEEEPEAPPPTNASNRRRPQRVQ
jgi:lambda family phage portal protein